MVRRVCYSYNAFHKGKNGMSLTHFLKGHSGSLEVYHFGERVFARNPGPHDDKYNANWKYGLW
eukprot:3494740-Alexandrium_andersonii.AAC.1